MTTDPQASSGQPAGANTPPAPPDPQPPRAHMKPGRQYVLLGYLVLSSLVFLWAIYGLWGAIPDPSLALTSSPADSASRPAQAGDAPRVVRTEPAEVFIGFGRQSVRVVGENFDSASVVLFNGVERVTGFVDATQLSVTLAASDYSGPGEIAVSVRRGGATSNTATLRVGAAGDVKGVWRLSPFRGSVSISQEVRLLLLVIFTGAFGSGLMAMRSLSDYAGDRILYASWTIHYLVRPPVGAGVALVFYLVVRGGFMSGTAIDAGAARPFGILAVSTLAGMFSEMAVNKLRSVFEALLRAEDPRTDTLKADGGLAITVPDLPSAKVGQDYKQTLTANGGTEPYAWSGTLPQGLAIGKDTGEISGKPSGPVAKAKYTVHVKDAKGAEASAKIELEVKA